MLITIALLTNIAVTGCSNDGNDTVFEAGQKLQSTRILSTEELLNTAGEDFSFWQTSEDGTVSRASSTTITIYGYSSQNSGGNYKLLISSEIANALSISKTIYIAADVTCYMDIKIEGLGTSSFFSPVSSPLCGLMPNGPTHTRGYTNTTPDADGNIRFATNLIHIISDLSGRSYDMWYPCNPADIQWIYSIVQ